MKAFLIFATLIEWAFGSSIFVDWSIDSIPNGVRTYVLDYSPPMGLPPAGTQLASSVHQIVINQTIPSTDYSIYISALMMDGTRRNISEKMVPSSPDSPILDSIETSSSDATISFFPPDGKDISFYIEYFPVDKEEYANFVETKSSLVKLRGLDPGTDFRLRILSVFRGVPSSTSIDTTFKTKDVGSAEEMSFTVKTLPPDLDLSTTPKTVLEYEYASKEGGSQEYTDGQQNTVDGAQNTVDGQQNTVDGTQNNKQQTPEPEYYNSFEESTNAFTTLTMVSIPLTTTTVIPITSTQPPLITEQSIDIVTPPPPPPSLSPVFISEPTVGREEYTDDYDSLSGNTVDQPTTMKINLKVTRRPTTTTTTESTTTTSRRQTTVTTIKETNYEDYDENDKDETTSIEQTTRTTTTTENMGKGESTDTTEKIERIETTEMKKAERTDPEIGEVDFTVDVTTRNALFEEYGEPTQIWLSKEGKMLKLEWEVTDEALCDAFMLNYTVLTLSQPKTFTIATQETWTLIKMFTDHQLELKVHCMLAGSLSKTWWAYRIADLSKPHPIENLRIKSFDTDEFYVSSIVVEWDWPVFHDFEFYKIVVAYGIGKAPPVEFEVTEKGPVTIEKLEPTQQYSISVRNSSIELGISSQPKGVKQLTPPLISSTLYPGQISSTAININFGASDPEQGQFTHYEMEFTGNAKNITKKIGMDKERSFTFTKLIPGKTYHFALYTVYMGVRSRPVTVDITTYPLKVDKLHPVVGRDYAHLYWDIENFADNDVRFRLSYIGTSNSGLKTEATVELKNKNHYRFDELNLETYYTFTITVIMGKGEAEAESESEMVTVAMHKEVRSSPSLQRDGTRELSLTFENDHHLWHELNGQINNFAIIVIEDLEQAGDDYELRSWFEVRNDETWPAYRASKSDYHPFRKRQSKEATFIIGEDDCEQQRLDEPYCNGMLRANVNYMVKIRGYTDEGIAMETEWVSINGVVGEGDEDQEKEDRGLPCHMYLNGCPRKGSEKKGFWTSLMGALGFLGR